MRNRGRPGGLDLLDRPSHADRVDARRGAERPDRDRHVVAAAGRIDHVGEQEGAALILREAALELPARERMQLGVLIDRPIDARDQPLRLEPHQGVAHGEPAHSEPLRQLLLPQGRSRRDRPAEDLVAQRVGDQVGGGGIAPDPMGLVDW